MNIRHRMNMNKHIKVNTNKNQKVNTDDGQSLKAASDNMKKQKLHQKFRTPLALQIIITILVPIAAFYLLEAFSHQPFEITWKIQLLNILFFMLLEVILLCITGRTSVASLILMFVALAVGLINYYTLQFRGTPVLPWDILSVKTAASVTTEYDFKVTWHVIWISLVMLTVAACSIIFTHIRIKGVLRRILSGAFGIVALILCTMGLWQKATVDFFELDDILFTPVDMYEDNGFAISFAYNLQYLRVKAPTGYDTETVYREEESYVNTNADRYSNPNIIVIMNESFCDPAVLTDFETNQDYMPFIHSLLEGGDNVVSGYAYPSVCGGNTANSEFEFLTGSSMAFLPEGSVAYQQYVKDETPALGWYLQSLDYRTCGMHPFGSAGWNRNTVYPNLGFEMTRFSGDMRGAQKMRTYISDAATYEMIEANYATKDDKSLFTFEITMQNHGGYFQDYDNFEREIELINTDAEQVDINITERYLSLVKKSDEAFEDLIQHFENTDEPVIILMFGDHQPGDYALKAIWRPEDDPDIQTLQQRYKVPFVMWANFDIESEYVEGISLNYLSTLLFQKAGVPLTGYQKFLSELHETFPVINAKGVVDAKGQYYAWGDDIPDEDGLLEKYKAFQYNMLFDEENRDNAFFGFSE
jgi:phosphoglycerol transferase MdoB-like AlkP superfamily enzyme